MEQFLHRWFALGQDELTTPQLRALYLKGLPCVNQEVLAQMNDCLTRLQQEGLINERHGKFHLTLDGMRVAQRSSVRVDKPSIEKAMVCVQATVQGWNHVAHQEGLPTIACVIVYGSVAKNFNQEDFGDVDCAIVWRKHVDDMHPTPPDASTCARLKGFALLSQLPQEPSVWDVEDVVEGTLMNIQHVSLGSVDQLQELSQFPEFAMGYLYKDAPLAQGDMRGVRKEEEDMLQYLTKFERSIDAHNPRPTPSL